MKRRIMTLVALAMVAAIMIGLFGAEAAVARKKKGTQGCTPGYWKQDQHFDSYPAPYTSATLFNAVFDDVPEFAGLTLPEVAALGGGGIYALGRHTVAALLNAASSDVDYDLTTAQVISAFNAVYPGGDYEALKNRFAGFNEQGCPLN